MTLTPESKAENLLKRQGVSFYSLSDMFQKPSDRKLLCGFPKNLLTPQR